MNLQFNTLVYNQTFNEWEIDEADFQAVTNAFPNWTFANGGPQDGVINVPCWNPVAILPLNPLYGYCIVDFVEFALTNPEAPVNEAVWELTGNEVTLVGQFSNYDGAFIALPLELV
jgi:hypothetical protein